MHAQVTVGIPTYNNAPTLRRAVESVLAQTRPDVQVHISDNCSTDGTAEVCRALVAADPRVICTRQEKNLGHYGNFRFLLQQAQTPYFMWLAGDDTIAPSYIARTLAVLEQDPGVVTCVSRVRFIQPNGVPVLAKGTCPLMADTVANLAKYLADPYDNSRIFGLHRTEALQRAFPPDRGMIAFDWALMAGTLLLGTHAEIPDVLMIRDETRSRAYIEMIGRRRGIFLKRWFPVLDVTWDLVVRQKIPLAPPVIRALVLLNMTMHLLYVRTFYPRYGKVERLLQRHWLWRLKIE